MRNVIALSLLALFAFGCGQAQKPEPVQPPEPTAPPYDATQHWRMAQPGEIDLPAGAIGALIHESGASLIIVGQPFQTANIRPLDVIKDALAQMVNNGSNARVSMPLTTKNDGRTALFGYQDPSSSPNSTTHVIVNEIIAGSGIMMLFVSFSDDALGSGILDEILAASYLISETAAQQIISNL